MRLQLNVYVCIHNYLLQKLKAVPPTAEEWAREGRPLALAPRGCRSSTHLVGLLASVGHTRSVRTHTPAGPGVSSGEGGLLHLLELFGPV